MLSQPGALPLQTHRARKLAGGDDWGGGGTTGTFRHRLHQCAAPRLAASPGLPGNMHEHGNHRRGRVHTGGPSPSQPQPRVLERRGAATGRRRRAASGHRGDGVRQPRVNPRPRGTVRRRQRKPRGGGRRKARRPDQRGQSDSEVRTTVFCFHNRHQSSETEHTQVHAPAYTHTQTHGQPHACTGAHTHTHTP